MSSLVFIRETKISRIFSPNEKRRYYAILFDLDGALIKSTYQSKEAKIALINKLKELGINVNNISMDDTTMDILSKANAQIKKNRDISLEDAKRIMNEILDRFDIEAISRSELIHNTKSVLLSLRNKGLRLGIVTNSSRQGVKFALEKFSLRKYFDIIVTRNDVEKIKPCEEGIIKALTSLGCRRPQVMYVGDSWVDIKAAKNAGVISVAITGGISRPERLQQESPDIIINSLNELLDII